MGISQVFLVLVRLLVLVVLARWITPAEFGLAGIVLLVVGFSDMIAGLGISLAIIQRKELSDGHIVAGWGINLAMSLMFAAMLYAASSTFAFYAGQEELVPLFQLSVLLFPINACSAIPKALLSRELRFKRLAVIDMVAFTLGYGIVGIVLAVQNYGALSLLSASLARAFLSMFLLWWVAPRFRFQRVSWQVCKDLLAVGPGYGIAQVGNYLARNADRFVVFKVFGAATLGVYTQAFMLAQHPENFLGQTIDQVLFPIMSSCQDDLQWVRRTFCRGCVLFGAFISPLTIPLITASTEVVLIALGPQWEEAGPVFQVMAFLLVIHFVNKLNICLTRATGAVYRRAWRIWMHLVLVLAFVWIGSSYNLIMVAIGVGVAALINLIMMTQLSLYLMQMSWGTFLKQFVRPGSIYIAVLAITWCATDLTRDAIAIDAAVVAVSLLVTFGIYASLIAFAPGLLLGDESQWMLNSIWKAIPSRFRDVRLVQQFLHQARVAS